LANQLLIAVRSDSGTKAKMQEHELPEILTSRSIPVGAGDVVLLADDEAGIRTLVRTILEANGYIVIEARNGLEGLAVCRTYAGRIDLLLSDVVMPELGGRELAQGALKLRPGLRILFMSGYNVDIFDGNEVSSGNGFLQKPFTPSALVQKVRAIMAWPEEPGRPWVLSAGKRHGIRKGS
jgi:CheY-like chemotaxis protein